MSDNVITVRQLAAVSEVLASEMDNGMDPDGLIGNPNNLEIPEKVWLSFVMIVNGEINLSSLEDDLISIYNLASMFDCEGIMNAIIENFILRNDLEGIWHAYSRDLDVKCSNYMISIISGAFDDFLELAKRNDNLNCFVLFLEKLIEDDTLMSSGILARFVYKHRKYRAHARVFSGLFKKILKFIENLDEGNYQRIRLSMIKKSFSDISSFSALIEMDIWRFAASGKEPQSFIEYIRAECLQAFILCAEDLIQPNSLKDYCSSFIKNLEGIFGIYQATTNAEASLKIYYVACKCNSGCRCEEDHPDYGHISDEGARLCQGASRYPGGVWANCVCTCFETALQTENLKLLTTYVQILLSDYFENQMKRRFRLAMAPFIQEIKYESVNAYNSSLHFQEFLMVDGKTWDIHYTTDPGMDEILDRECLRMRELLGNPRNMTAEFYLKN